MLGVSFTGNDLNLWGISYDSTQIVASIKDDSNKAMIETDLAAIANQKSLRDILFSDELPKRLKALVKNYQDTLAQTQPTQQADLTKALNQAGEADSELQLLFDRYPHAPGGTFPPNPHLFRLKNLRLLKENDIDDIFKNIRDSYDASLEAIAKDFLSHDSQQSSASSSSLSSSTQVINPLTISEGKYFKSAVQLRELIANNPKAMQVNYRRIVLLEREKQMNESALRTPDLKELQPLKSEIHPHATIVIELVEKAMVGIKKYQAMPRTLWTLGLFSRIFEKNLGKNRADFYERRLSHATSTKECAVLLYALLATNDGEKLKAKVCGALPQVAGVQDGREHYMRQLMGILTAIYIKELPAPNQHTPEDCDDGHNDLIRETIYRDVEAIVSDVVKAQSISAAVAVI